MHKPALFILLAGLMASPILPAQEDAPPAGPIGWLSVVHAAPAAGVIHVSLAEGVQGQAQPGKMLGPVGLKAGPVTVNAKLGETNFHWAVELAADTRTLVVMRADAKDGLASSVITLPPAGDGKRKVLRLPGTGDKVWKIGKKELPVSTLVPFSGKLSIKDAAGAVVMEADSEEPGIYLIAPSAEEGEIEVVFAP